jgi:chemotaxis protein methyltransferase CheR
MNKGAVELTPFKNLIRDKCGLVFEGSREKTLAEKIHARMSERGLSGLSEYFSRLLNEQDELNKLINLLTINETYFYREPAHFRVLAERLMPEVKARKDQGMKVRILSAGCSTGEEPYSAVIELMENYGRSVRDSVSVHAVDIDGNAIGTAREGLFGKMSFRGLDSGLRKKYFQKAGKDKYRLKDFVRETVAFTELNLMSDEYPDSIKGMDVLFYRNVSLYFKPEVQAAVFGKLARTLNDGGYVIVSSTETFFHNIGVLSLVEIDGMFLYRKVHAPDANERERPWLRAGTLKAASGRPALSGGSGSAVATGTVDRLAEAEKLLQDALSLAGEKRYEEALVIIDDVLSGNAHLMKAHTLKAGILINLHRMQDAAELCRRIIDIQRWNLEVYILLGLISKLEGNEEEAIRKFKEALYIQPLCWLPHYYLAELYHARGRLEMASREYGIVTQLLEDGKFKEHGLTFFPLSFSAEQMLHLCRHNLGKLKERVG